MLQKISFLFLSVLISSQAFSVRLNGDLKDWKIDHFVGFDSVGDCQGTTGDISGVYARWENDYFIVRVTFDNMVTRKSNMVISDNFIDKNISIQLLISKIGDKNSLFEKVFSIQSIDGVTDDIQYLRTTANNLLEVELPGSPFMMLQGQLQLIVRIYINGKIVDEFQSRKNGSKDAGNCAFVHHGNQGLTHTDVFYGNAWGLSGLDGSGYDEVLQVHEATMLPGNFHMSGTLMPAAEWHNPEFNDWLETMASNGLVSMMTSALGQHIMPFVTNEMNDWSVYVESQMVDYHYNYIPRIAWVPERVWLAQGYYPDAGVIDWLGDNWEQHGVWGVVLDDGPHLNGYDNRKIHWMSNGSGVSLRVIPINNTFVGNMHYDATAAKNQIASMGSDNICVYGTDWEVAAEMNEHDGTFFLDNYEDVLWYCHDNYPGVNVWKLEDAIQNPNFNGSSANITKGTYGLLGGAGGYGGSNNSWYSNWASTPSHSDSHSPQWDYGTVWYDAYSYLSNVNDNSLAQLAWYTLMINLHETGWHTEGEVADWEHRYSSHIKNANVYTEASRWADGQYLETTACYTSDVDHDGIDELVMHNDKVFMVFEEIGGKANWVFYKNGFGQAYSVVSSDMAYWSETDGDYNENSNNHFAALSEVWPNQQNSIYTIDVVKPFGDTVVATLDQWGVQKTFRLTTGNDFLDVEYNFFDQTGYVKSGWSPDLLDLIWSGKGHLERVYGDYGSYCGYRNSASGATAALVLGNGGASQNGEFEGTLVKGDEINGYNEFKVRLFAGYTSAPVGTTVTELDLLAEESMDVFEPKLFSPVALVASNAVMLSFSEAVDELSAENLSNYSFLGFGNSYTITNAVRQSDWSKVKLNISGAFIAGDEGQIVVTGVDDLQGNTIGDQNIADLIIPNGITPHSIVVDGINDFQSESELMLYQMHSLYITWDATNLYIGFYDMDLNNEGDLFVNIDTDQLIGSGATAGSWGRVNFTDPYLPEYQVAIEGGGGSMQVNNFDGTSWTYPGNGVIGNSYEGWANNGLTEISIPWSDLGDPEGIALSVHVSEEDNQTIPESFPPLNQTGNNPTIEYFYAFYEPFIVGPMPLSGMEPNAAYAVPNTPAEIVDYTPLNLNPVVEVDASQTFGVSAQDAENDELVYSWRLDGTEMGITDSYDYNPIFSDLGNHTLRAIVTDGIPGHNSDTVSWSIEVIDNVLRISLNVFLEGPYESIQMNTDLNDEGVIPLAQPYYNYPWYYFGIEEVVSIPGINIVDWVLVELRDAPSAELATSATTIARRAAFVDKDGSVKGIDGSNVLTFENSLNEQLFVVIWHRDHLGILSANALLESMGIYSYDFSTSSGQVYGGTSGYKELSPGVWGMVGGDANADGSVDDSDKTNYWNAQVGTAGYQSGDFGMDSQVNNSDKNDIWVPNSGGGSKASNTSGTYYKCQVPE